MERQTADRINARSFAWQAMSGDLELIKDLMGGTSTMRAAGLRWLPRERAESWPAWRARLHRTVLFNGFARTIQALSGKPFMKPIYLSETAAPEMLALAKNMNGQGQTLSEFAHRLLQLLLRDGLAHILLDRPRSGGAPYFILQPAENLIGSRLDSADGLQDIRLSSTAIQPVGQFGERQSELIRRFTADSWEVWMPQAGSDDHWNLTASGTHNLGAVPLITMNVNATGHMMARPPLLDLAWLNLAHWQSSSDQRHILHVARVPILFGRAMQIGDEQLDIGPNRLIMADDPASDLKFVEHSGAAIAAGRQDLIDLEDRMAVMGLEMLTNQPGQITATAKAIDSAQNHAALTGILQVLEDGLLRAFKMAAQWLGLAEECVGDVIISKRWQMTDEKTALADWLLKARLAGEISAERFLVEVERAGVLGPANDDQNNDKIKSGAKL